MYDSNDLIDVGTVSTVVLGLIRFGDDPDGSSFPVYQEFSEDLPFSSDLLPPQ